MKVFLFLQYNLSILFQVLQRFLNLFLLSKDFYFFSLSYLLIILHYDNSCIAHNALCMFRASFEAQSFNIFKESNLRFDSAFQINYKCQIADLTELNKCYGVPNSADQAWNIYFVNCCVSTLSILNLLHLLWIRAFVCTSNSIRSIILNPESQNRRGINPSS